MTGPRPTETRRFEFNGAFRAVNDSRHYWRILKGSANSGKSYNVAADYVLKLSSAQYAGANLIVVRKTEDSHGKSTYSQIEGTIRRIFGRHADAYWIARKSPYGFECRATGARIIFAGVYDDKQREKIKSVTVPHGKLCWMWVEEATELTESDLDMLSLRLRGDLTDINPSLYYQITLTFNPVSAAHWIKARFFDRPQPDCLLHNSTWKDNHFQGKGYAETMGRLEKDNPDLYKVYALGEWGETGGLILTSWVSEAFNRSPECYDDTAVGQDFGFNHANAVLALGYRDGEIYIRDEIYKTGLTTPEMIRLADGVISKVDTMWCDSAEPDRIAEWVKAGYGARAVKKSHDTDGIDFLRSVRIHVHPDCRNTIRELSLWKWAKDERTGLYTDRPVKALNDAMDALRYGVSAWSRYAPVPRTDKTDYAALAEERRLREYISY